MAEFLDSPDAELWIALWERERLTCPVHHGPVDECPDDQRDWFPQRRVCWPTAQLEAAKRLYAAIHEDRPYHDGSFNRWAEKPSHEYPFHYADGVSIYLAETDENPEDDFLGGTSAAEKPVGEHR